MQGLKQIPGTDQLIKAYNQIQSGELITEDDIVLYSHWARFDPRLGELLVEYLQKSWSQFNPMQIRTVNLKSVWPQALAVLLEHVDSTLPPSETLFRYFKSIILDGLSPAPYQSFTIGLFKPGGRQLFERAVCSHPYFKKWGYYESEPLYSKFQSRPTNTELDLKTRKNILRELLMRKKRITVKDYIEACRFAIHRRQAERDLNNFFKLKKTGRTRSRVYWR